MNLTEPDTLILFKLIDLLLEADRNLFLFLNGLHSDFFDFIMYWISDKYIWIPFYAWLLLLLMKNFRKDVWKLLLLITLMITLSDQLSVHLFKNTIMRLRPCHEPELAGLVHLVNEKCGGLYGFISSHATNSFSIATFISLLFAGKFRWMPWLMVCWSCTVSYSRIYLGVHYPGDVLAGAMFGSMLGFIFYVIYSKIKRPVAGLQ